MPGALMIKPIGASSAAIESICKGQGLRVKEVNSFSIAKEWLTLREFDLIFIHAAYSDAERDEFAALTWKKSPLTYLILFNMDEKLSTSEQDGRLSGYEVATDESASTLVADIIERVKTLKDRGDGMPEVMVVEDLDSPRDIICTYVESLGTCQATGIASAQEALGKLEETPDRWACILTDIRMPAIDGREFIAIIRRHAKLQHIPVIVLTAYGTMDTLIDCLKAGASGFMVKPPRKEDLVREIARALRIREYGESPRLATEGEVEIIRDQLLKRQGLDVI